MCTAGRKYQALLIPQEWPSFSDFWELVYKYPSSLFFGWDNSKTCVLQIWVSQSVPVGLCPRSSLWWLMWSYALYWLLSLPVLHPPPQLVLPASRRKPPALNICLRSAFGKNQIRSRPSYQGHQNPCIRHRCAKKQPSSAGTTILLGGPGHWPGPHQLQGRSPLGISHFLQGPKSFSPRGSRYFCGEEVLACSSQLHPNHSIFELSISPSGKWARLSTSVSGYENE